ncbi:hypothetical protein [Erythrobacter sp. MTPC3]|uniref:hypothetical protein n=1 Tax=Erythrobacter sp. MTPC3 TaxID=3056564 RepID=UPI0036F253BC
MNKRFLDVISNFEDKLSRLMACDPMKFGELPLDMPKCGVYLFSDGDRSLYVGRSNRLRERYFLHCCPGSRQNQASFAYKLAREDLGIGPPSYLPGSGRAVLAASEDFQVSFNTAKKRIRTMNFRYVAEEDQPRQALLEAYCAIALRTPYNDFETH